MYLSPSMKRTLTLVLATFLGLVCGTVYLYSSYSPQFAARLGYTVSQLSAIAMVGTMGSALSGPVAGLVVDTCGYTLSLVTGGTLIVAGYVGMKFQYDQTASSVLFSCVLYFMVGAGSTFINSANLKCCAVTFPGIKGIATALPLLMYGLSASVFSFLGSVFVPGDTSRFLGLLAVVNAAIFVVCAPLVCMCDDVKSRSSGRDTPKMLELETFTSANMLPRVAHVAPEITGSALFRDPKFWGLFIALGVFAGLGQMYIFSVGFMVSALTGGYDFLVTHPSAVTLIQQEQQYQVAVLSVANCAGRIVSGAVGDLVTRRFLQLRIVVLLVPAVGFVVSQLLGARMPLKDLWLESALTGVVYGFTYCVFPLTVADMFGMANYSLNWGIVGLAPILPAYMYNSYFGKVYDANVVEKEFNGAIIKACNIGRDCYDKVFYRNLWSAFVGAVMVIWLVWRVAEEQRKTSRRE
ncbi:hypothetical protein BABINDRAFT_145119 [Babjeviella inositovora NRRL Y-12698]|uniref:Nodulin-like domain-containing protein n=1 Tax=Babjeviella inositovora NRRL Y-12698 TaxID=984486 RepID=A0A1E3QRK7_9ASCO|nr:uncharacterized protein BABINDRAFT_145119 [Babjeviella inositovora NRRL Y-12698]ODQ79577.1 hypothetical protein BABINDRAFT_145119 [Babjeviella inositovora NRRL Y-12698]